MKRDIIGIVEKAKERSLDTGMQNRTITVLHEQWVRPGMQRHTSITLCSMHGNNLIPISNNYDIFSCLDSLSLADC